MRVTVEIADELRKGAREATGKRRTTLRALVEEGLRGLLRESAA